MARKPDRSRFLMELKAKLASETSEEMIERIQAEQAVQDVLLELSDSHDFRVVEDYRYTTGEEEKRTDFILQVEDFELRLIMEYSPTGRPTLTANDLRAVSKILESSTSTIALAVVWAASDLPTLVITQGLVEFLLADGQETAKFVKTALPLKDAILRFVDRQTKGWGLRRVERVPAEEMLPDAQTILERKLREELGRESTRAYKLERKVAAQKSIRRKDVETIARIFEQSRRASKDAQEITDDLRKLIDKWQRGEGT